MSDGRAPKGNPFSIYVKKHGNVRTVEIDDFIFGRICGLRTLKGEQINYFDPGWNDQRIKVMTSWLKKSKIKIIWINVVNLFKSLYNFDASE